MKRSTKLHQRISLIADEVHQIAIKQAEVKGLFDSLKANILKDFNEAISEIRVLYDVKLQKHDDELEELHSKFKIRTTLFVIFMIVIEAVAVVLKTS